MYCRLEVDVQESEEPASENGEPRSERDVLRAQWTIFLGVAVVIGMMRIRASPEDNTPSAHHYLAWAVAVLRRMHSLRVMSRAAAVVSRRAAKHARFDHKRVLVT